MFFGVIFAALSLTGIAATIINVVRDGYHQVPTVAR